MDSIWTGAGLVYDFTINRTAVDVKTKAIFFCPPTVSEQTGHGRQAPRCEPTA